MKQGTSSLPDGVPSGRRSQQPAKWLAPLVIAGCMYAGVARASKSVTGSLSLGAGTSEVAACQSGTLYLTLVPTYSSAPGAYSVGSVIVRGLDTAAGGCGSKSYSISLMGGASDATLGGAHGVTPSAGDTLSVDLSPQRIPVSSVGSVQLVISGY